MKQGASKPEMQTAAGTRGALAQREPSKPLADATARDRTKLSPEKLRELVAVAAYYRAEHRLFTPGFELDDWLAAEAEIQERFSSEKKTIS